MLSVRTMSMFARRSLPSFLNVLKTYQHLSKTKRIDIKRSFSYSKNSEQKAHNNSDSKKPHSGLINFSFSTLIALGLTQNYLAKNGNKSSLYWRNSPILSDMAFQLAHYKHLDHAMSILKVFSAADFNVKQLTTAFYEIPSLRRLKKVFDKLDDIVDTPQLKMF